MSSKKRRITVKSAKAKGRKFQQFVAERISVFTGIPFGKDELIRSREMGQSGVDIVLLGRALDLFPFSVEAKNQEKISLWAWIKQAKENQKEGTDWLLFCKRNREDPIVVMDMGVFFKIIEKKK